MAGARVIPRARPATCTMLLHISDKEPRDARITTRNPHAGFGWARRRDGWLLRTASLCTVLMMLSAR